MSKSLSILEGCLSGGIFFFLYHVDLSSQPRIKPAPPAVEKP